jgi:hypothetical protein
MPATPRAGPRRERKGDGRHDQGGPEEAHKMHGTPTLTAGEATVLSLS